MIVNGVFTFYSDFVICTEREGLIVYNNQQMSDRIKSQAKSKKIALKKMLEELGLGINLISHLAKGQNITAINLARIADYLDCSVDYLLGRTDKPEVNR